MKLKMREIIGRQALGILLFIMGGLLIPLHAAESKTVNNAKKKPEIVSRMLTENDQWARALKVTFVDKNLKPTTHGSLSSFLEKITLGAQNFSSITFVYKSNDPNEIPAVWEFFDRGGAPAVTSEGYSRIELEASLDGKVYSCVYKGLDGSLIDTKEGFASMKRIYDGAGNLTEEGFYDKDGNRALNKRRGYSAIRIAYVKNDKQEYEERTYIDTQGNPLMVDGAYKHVKGVTKGVDPMTVIQSYNNMNDQLMVGPQGYALHVKRELDSANNPKEAYLNEKSELVNGPDGYAKMDYSIEDKTKEEKLEYKNSAGELVNNAATGWAYKTFKRNDKGQEIEVTHYKADGSPLEQPEKETSDTGKKKGK